MNLTKLDGLTNAKPIATPRRGAKQTTAANTPSSSGSAGPLSVSDTVNTSGWAATIEQLTNLSTQLPEVRQERIESLQLLVSSGSYQPAAHVIAQAIVANELR